MRKAGFISVQRAAFARAPGLTELEEAALTDGQGRALSAHQTRSSYSGYAKETRERMLSATIKRRESRLQILQDDGENMPRRAVGQNER